MKSIYLTIICFEITIKKYEIDFVKIANWHCVNIPVLFLIFLKVVTVNFAFHFQIICEMLPETTLKVEH